MFLDQVRIIRLVHNLVSAFIRRDSVTQVSLQDKRRKVNFQKSGSAIPNEAAAAVPVDYS